MKKYILLLLVVATCLGSCGKKEAPFDPAAQAATDDAAIQAYLKGIEFCGQNNPAAKAELAWNLATIYRDRRNMNEYMKWRVNASTWAPEESDIYKLLALTPP